MVYFESKKRDGAGRIGELKTREKKVKTPCLLDLKIDLGYEGSLWSKNQEKDEVEVKVLGNKLSPNSVPKEVASYFSKQNTRKQESNGKINSPVIGGGRWSDLRENFSKKIRDTEIVTIEALKTLKTRDQLNKIIYKIREGVSEDTALFAPGVATTKNLAYLIYLGIDLFDSTRAKIDASKGNYYANNGIKRLSNLSHLPCNCSICNDLELNQFINKKPKEIAELLEIHNLFSLESELNYVKNAIEEQNFREYLEQRIKVSPDNTGALRNIDKDLETYQEKRTPTFKRSKLFANTIESLDRPEIKRFRKRVLNRYKPPETEVAVLLPCSAKKPYSKSRTHQIIKSVLKEKGNQIIVTSPLGLVPRELELIYPAQHYDLPVIGEWLEREKKIIKKMIKHYFSKNSFEKVIIHLDNTLSFFIKEILEEIKVNSVITSIDKDPRNKESLNKLIKEIKGYKEIERDREIINSTLDYQFGYEKRNKPISDAQIKGRFPRYKAIIQGKQIGEITPNYGSFALTTRGAEIIEPKNYFIEIEDFIPQGSVLAPGVIDAGEEIRPKDEVFFEGKKAKGVGRAKMSGFEMKEASRGIAVQVRHVEEK